MKQLRKYPLLCVAALFLVVCTAVDLVVAQRKFSEMENRELAQRPKLTWRSLISLDNDAKFSQLYETYINDQFVGRDAWITLKSLSETALGKKENNSIVYGEQGFQFEKEQSYDWWRADVNTEAVSSFGKTSVAPVDFGLIPSSYCIYEDYLPRGLGNIQQQEVIGRVYEEVSPFVNTVDVAGALLQQRDVNENSAKTLPSEEDSLLYYRNDHHWTTNGAYAAYAAYVESLGLQPVSQEELAPYARYVEGFYGTYYNKSKLATARADTILYYDLPMESVLIDGEEKSTLNNNALWSAHNKYAAFLWDNNGLTVLKSSRPQQGETKRLLLLKDSFGNCFAPFLTLHYDEVYVVDLRYLPTTVSALMEEVSFDRALVLYNVSTYGRDTYLMRIHQ